MLTMLSGSLLVTGAAAQTTALVGFPAQAVATANTAVPPLGTRIALGDSKKRVEKKLGVPMTRLSTDAWLYENVEITLPGKPGPRAQHIHVIFTDGKLSTLAIVSDRARDGLIAAARAQAATIANTN